MIIKEEVFGSFVIVDEVKKFLVFKDKLSGDIVVVFEEGGDVDDLLDMI